MLTREEEEQLFSDQMEWFREVRIKWEMTSLKEHREKLKGWLEEPGMKEFADKSRLRYLAMESKWLRGYVKELDTMYRQLLRSESACLVPIVEKKIDEIKSKLRKYKLERKSIMTGAVEDIPLEMIMRAKDYPIEQIITVGKNGRAKCVFHEGENDNMDIRKNFAYCYKCNESGDAITVYMKLHDCTFKQAVKALV